MKLFTTGLMVVAICVLLLSIIQFFSIRKSLKDTLNKDAGPVRIYGNIYFALLLFFLIAYMIFTVDWVTKEAPDPMHLMLLILLFFGSVFVGISTMFLRKFIESVLGVRMNQVDTMTGVMTKSGIEIAGSRLLKMPDSHNVLAVMDLDNFKMVNDTYGHVEGDEVIKVLAEILNDAVRAGDLVGRFGGDEFIVILKSVTPEEGKAVMERVRRNVCSAMVSRNYDFRTGISVGISEMNGNNHITYQQVFDKADAALYEAKNNGGNQVVIK